MKGNMALTVLVALYGATGEGTAQGIPVHTIDEAELVFARDFSDLRSLRPLSTGALIAVEGMGGAVVLLAADGTSDSPIGKRGQGPGEYMDPARVVPLGESDFSLLVDPALQRLLIIAPTGDVVVSEPWRLPPFISPIARDASEGVYYDEAGFVRMDQTGQIIEGPGPILRVTPRPPTVDTLAMIRVYDLRARWEASPVSKMFSPGPNGLALFNLAGSPFGAQDQWQLMADGRIAIARARPYRVDVVSPGGALTEGPHVTPEPIRVTRADQQTFIADMQRGTQGNRRTGGSWSGGDGQQRQLQPAPPDTELVFPDTKPAFPLGGLHVTVDEILVQRHVAHDADHALIDVFDGSGRLTRQIELPAGRILKAATREALYTLVYNEFDVQVLERYAR